MDYWRTGLKWLRLGAHVMVGLGVLGMLPLAGRRAGPLAAWWYRRLLDILAVAVQIRGRIPGGACLAVSNHVSWLDIILLGALLDAVFVSKAEIGGWPLVGRFARYTGTVFLPRGAGRTDEATRRLAAALGAGRCVVLFPEATTGRSLLPARFHPRLFAAAVATDLPVQPVAIHYLPDPGQAGHHPLAPWVGEAGIGPHFRRLFRLPLLTVRVHFCAPLTRPGAQTRRALAEASHAAISAALVQDRGHSAPAGGQSVRL